MTNARTEELDEFWKRVTTLVFHQEVDLDSYEGNLYHYTSPIGLEGILNSQKIWGTEASYLSDSQEIKYGINFVSNELKNYSANKDSWVKELIQLSISSINQHDHQEIYMACFCEDGDLLSQWKGYSNLGEGFSIGLNSRELSRFKRKHPFVNIGIWKVIYKEEDQKRIVQEEIDYIVKRTKEIIDKYHSDKKEIITNSASCLAYYLKVQLVRFKNDVFKEEQEWRAIYVNDERSGGRRKKVKFRVSGKDIIPYIELDIAPSAQKEKWYLPISEIIVGPKINYIKAKRSIDLIYRNISELMPSVEMSIIKLQ